MIDQERLAAIAAALRETRGHIDHLEAADDGRDQLLIQALRSLSDGLGELYEALGDLQGGQGDAETRSRRWASEPLGAPAGDAGDRRCAAGLTEDQRRLYARDQLAQHNKALAAAAEAAAAALLVSIARGEFACLDGPQVHVLIRAAMREAEGSRGKPSLPLPKWRQSAG
jgi:hypothetical protein